MTVVCFFLALLGPLARALGSKLQLIDHRFIRLFILALYLLSATRSLKKAAQTMSSNAAPSNSSNAFPGEWFADQRRSLHVPLTRLSLLPDYRSSVGLQYVSRGFYVLFSFLPSLVAIALLGFGAAEMFSLYSQGELTKLLNMAKQTELTFDLVSASCTSSQSLNLHLPSLADNRGCLCEPDGRGPLCLLPAAVPACLLGRLSRIPGP